MREYIVINVPADLLPQVTGELLQFASDPNLVEVAMADLGRVIHAHPEVADAWYKWRQEKENPPATEPAPEAQVEPVPVVVEPEPEPQPDPEPDPDPVVPAPKKRTSTASASANSEELKQ